MDKFKTVEETRFLTVLHLPHTLEQYPVKKIRGVKDSTSMDITIFKMKNPTTGTADAVESLLSEASMDIESIPTLTFRMPKEASVLVAEVEGAIWTIFASKKSAIEWMSQTTGKEVKLL